MGEGERLPLTRHGLRDVIGEGAGFGNIIKRTLGGEETSGPQGIIFFNYSALLQPLRMEEVGEHAGRQNKQRTPREEPDGNMARAFRPL